MDEVFFMDEETRDVFLRTLAQALGCTYLCLWSYYPFPSNQLFSIHGWYKDDTVEPSSSSQTYGLARTLFNAYRQTLHTIENGCVPGLAFKEGVPYLELKELELLNQASSDVQRQFYQEARIKKAAFMGCKSGEIEIGLSNLNLQINMEMELRNWFPAEELYPHQQHSHKVVTLKELPSSWISSSSSPLRSLSVGSSPEYSSLLLNNMPITTSSSSFLPHDQLLIKESSSSILFDQQTNIRPNNLIPITTTVPPHGHQQATDHQHNNPLLGTIQFPNAESDDAAMTRAMLAVISSATASYNQIRDYGRRYHGLISQSSGAFKNFVPGLAPSIHRKRKYPSSQGQDALKRAIVFYRNMYLRRKMEEQAVLPPGISSRPTSSQLHHKMSERKRREKLNESFESLRSLLPPTSKKDKASLLSNTRDYLSSLKAEVSELKQKNRLLEASASPVLKRARLVEAAVGTSSIINRNVVEISITQASESTLDQEREIELQVAVRGDSCNVMDLVIRILEFLKQINDISLLSMEVDRSQRTNPSHRAIFRLKIKGNEFDDSTFQEAIKRVVADVAK